MTGSAFTYYSFTHVATQSCVTISFGFEQDLSFWTLDDISVSDGVIQYLINGGFEAVFAYTGWIGANHLSSGNCHCGSYCYYDGSVGLQDNVYQSMILPVGRTYNISFYLSTGTGSSGVYANVTISSWYNDGTSTFSSSEAYWVRNFNMHLHNDVHRQHWNIRNKILLLEKNFNKYFNTIVVSLLWTTVQYN